MIIPCALGCIRILENVAGVINNKTRYFLESWINTKQYRILDSELKKWFTRI